jgi:asparagine synthetase B (glutamine-hydrolysing)
MLNKKINNNYHFENDLLNKKAIYDFLIFNSFLGENNPDLSQKNPVEWDINEQYFYEKSIKDESFLVRNFIENLENYVTQNLGSKNALLYSGGLDSSIILPFMPKDTYCLTHIYNKAFDWEKTLSRNQTKKFGIKNHEFIYGNAHDLYLNYIEIIEKIGMPIRLNRAMPFIHMFLNIKEKNISNTFTGQNLDRLFFSFSPYLRVKNILKIKKYIPTLITKNTPQNISKYFSIDSINYIYGCTTSEGIISCLKDVDQDYWPEKDFITEKLCSTNFIKSDLKKIILNFQFFNEVVRTLYPIANQHKINLKAPFYSSNFIKLALNTDNSLLRKKGYDKYLIKRIAEKLNINEEIILRKKRGLYIDYEDFEISDNYKKTWKIISEDKFIKEYVDMNCLYNKKSLYNMDVLRSLYVWKEIFLEGKETTKIYENLFN